MKYDLKISKATDEEKDMIKNFAEKFISENNLSSEIGKKHCYYLCDTIYLVKEETQNFILTHMFDTKWHLSEGDHYAYYLTIKDGIFKIFRIVTDAHEPYYHYYETLKDSDNKSLEYQAIDVYYNYTGLR